jgi:hypothetical protein
VLKGRRGMGFAGVGGGGAEVGCEDSVVPAGPRGWERRLPIVSRCWCCCFEVGYWVENVVGFVWCGS